MLTIEPIDAVLGATVRGIDLARDIAGPEFARILRALGRYGVLRFPGQQLNIGDVQRFSELFGEIQGSISRKPDPDKMEHPECRHPVEPEAGRRYIGSPDAGQDWHTDMSYRDMMGFVNVLYGIRIPRRDGKPLGGTEFANMHAVYDALPADIKARLDGMTATHDFEKFWENMRQNHGSTRPALTEEQRSRRPPVVHPVFLTHPITGRKVLYANPGYTTRINELPRDESDSMLEFLFDFQLEPRFRWTHDWTENDLLIWDHLGTIHRAIADYGPDEIRLMRRCQVMATKVFDPAFLRPVRELAMAEAD